MATLSRYIRVSGIPSAEVQGETVLLSLERQNYFGLREVARRVWELLAEPRSLAELCAELCREFEVSEETCRKEVVAFISRLQSEKLVQLAE